MKASQTVTDSHLGSLLDILSLVLAPSFFIIPHGILSDETVTLSSRFSQSLISQPKVTVWRVTVAGLSSPALSMVIAQ